ncbi:TauD/TfdA family dioxygenase, partial [Burkholderia pseudomallei]|uniref:TauD/TfdA dioxygenase family protein n=1 Tax=Burkholderia pseudomallei TaxID=28450 RepID=UPI003457B2D1
SSGIVQLKQPRPFSKIEMARRNQAGQGHYAQRFVQYDTHDSNRLYEILQAHITRLENTVRWHWAAGDVAIWDNRSTQHYAINDYGDATRVMRRVTVIGDIPVAVDGRKSIPHEA